MNKVEMAYIITSHGFGHASRACAVMQAMQNKKAHIHFHIYSSIPEWFFLESHIESFTIHHLETDIGLVQTSPFEIDYQQTIFRLSDFYGTFQEKIKTLGNEFRHQNIKAVVSDIAALGIAAAHQIDIPVFLVENFTWDWIYEAYQDQYPAFKPFVGKLRESIKLATYHYLTEPFCQYPRSVHGIAKPISRLPVQAAQITKEKLGIPSSDKVVLLSLGGIPDQIQINASSMEKKGITFIVPGIGEQRNREGNTIFLPHHSAFYHPDLVAAADAVIAKVGYSTIAEAYAARLPMGYIPRQDFPESKFLSAYIQQKLGGTEIKFSEFLSGKWVDKIDQILETTIDQTPVINGADQISDWIINNCNFI